MKLRIVESTCKAAAEIDNVPCFQLIQLNMSMYSLPGGTIGYKCSYRRFVVIAGAPLGIYDAVGDTPVEILTSGTLTLEIE